jgi:HAD superfamily hydrolase (TIGR01548 family)
MDEVNEVKALPGFNDDWDATWAVIGRRLHHHIRPPSDVDRGSYAYRRMQDVFQTYYLGDRLWREMSHREPPLAWSEPLILRETRLATPETLQRLGAYPVGIATSRPRAEALMALRQHGMNALFRDEYVVAKEDAPVEKPHPAPILELMRRLRCRKPVYVGDTINDALAALAAGITFIYVGRTPLRDERLHGRIRYSVRALSQIFDVCSVALSLEAGRD